MLYAKDIYSQLEEISNSSINTIKGSIAKSILYFAQEHDNFIINDIASNSYTSVSSVTKFCQNLGFTGWKEFYTYLKSEIHEKKEKVSLQQNSQNNNLSANYINKLTQIQLKITNRIINNNIRGFLEVHNQIITTHKIFIISDSSNYDYLLHNFTEQLMIRGFETFLIGNNVTLLAIILKRLTSEDLLIAFFIENISDNFLINLLNDKLTTDITIKYVILNNNFMKEKIFIHDKNPISDNNNGALYSYQKVHNALFIIFNIILQLLDDFQ